MIRILAHPRCSSCSFPFFQKSRLYSSSDKKEASEPVANKENKVLRTETIIEEPEKSSEENEKDEQEKEKAWSRRVLTTKIVFGVLGLVGAGIFHQFAYVRRLEVYRDALNLVQNDEDLERECGELEKFKWYDVRGIVYGWDWRPRMWLRELLFEKSLYTRNEEIQRCSFKMKGEKQDLLVHAESHRRSAGVSKVNLVLLKAKPVNSGIEFVLRDRRNIYPDNMIQ